jgi:putrescine transport system substrate-binding protein
MNARDQSSARATIASVVAIGTLALSACGQRSSNPPVESATIQARAAAESRVVNLYNWADYIDPEILKTFEQETGVAVRYDTFDSSEMLQTKLLTGRTGYDVVVTSASFVQRQVGAGVLRTLNLDAIPNRRNLDPDLMAMLDRNDPGGRHSVPYMWVITGIGLDATEVGKVAAGAPLDSWRLVFDPKYAAQLGRCGLAVIDSPSDVIASALIYLGYDADSAVPAQLQAAEDTLMSIRPFVRYVNSEVQVADLESGQICATIGWNGDLAQARSRAAEAGQPRILRFVIPGEGSVILVDLLAIPADAPHAADAERFINFLLRPDIAARNADYVHYPSPNLAARPLIAPATRNDPGVYPPPEARARLHALQGRSPEQMRAESRIWTRFRTGV